MSEALTIRFDGSAVQELIPSIVAAIDSNPSFAKELDALLDDEPDPFELKWDGLSAKAQVSPRLAALMAAHGVSP